MKSMNLFEYSSKFLYLQIILVRHPFDRLVSAFNAKMRPEGGQTEYYAEISRKINADYKHLRGKGAEKDDGFAIFQDFARYLSQLGGPEKRDHHWRQYSALCNLCNHNLDIIMKFDTYKEDLRYVKHFLNVEEEHLQDFFPEKETRTNSNMTETYFKTVPLNIRRKLYELYKDDFEYFGYEKPSYV